MCYFFYFILPIIIAGLAWYFRLANIFAKLFFVGVTVIVLCGLYVYYQGTTNSECKYCGWEVIPILVPALFLTSIFFLFTIFDSVYALHKKLSKK